MSKLSERVADAKRSYSVRDTVERYTGKVIPAGNRIVCPMPFHTHKSSPTPSMMVFDNYFKCHGASCEASGDVIDFVGYMRFGSSYKKNDPAQTEQVLDELRCTVVQRIPEYQKEAPRPYIPTKRVDQLHAALKQSPLAQEYLKYRHIDGLEDEFRLGYQSRVWRGRRTTGHYLAIPAFEFGQCIGIKYRRIDIAYDTDEERDEWLRFDSEEGSRLGTFNLDNAIFSTGKVVVVEAEITAMRLWKDKITAVAPTNGAKSIDTRLREYLGLAEVFILGDNDENKAGEAGAVRRRDIIGHGKIVYPPAQFKDLDEYLNAGGLASEIIK